MGSFSGADEVSLRKLIDQHKGAAKKNLSIPPSAKKSPPPPGRASSKPISLDQLQTAINNAVNTCAKTKSSPETKSSPPAPDRVQVVRSEEDLKKLQSTGQLVVVDWFATWCGPCVNFKPTFEKMAKEYEDVLFCKVDVDEAHELAAKYAISSMPTFKVSFRTQNN